MSEEKPTVSKIEITIKDGEVSEFTNDSDLPYYMVSRDGFFMISNYPLTIECATCKGKGKVGIIDIKTCEECEGSGEIDIYKKKDEGQ